MNAWCAEWGSRIKFFFSELYFRTWCGNSGRIAADFYLHPSEIPDAFMVLHCALLAVVVVVLKVLLFSDKVQPTLSHLRVTLNPPIAAGPERVHVLAPGAAGQVQHPVHGQGVHPL